MRLAFCNATRSWGGVKTWSIEFAAALQERGHELFLYGRDPVFLSRARERGLAAVAVAFGYDFHPATIAFFWQAFRRNGIQAVLVNVGKELRSAGVAARLRGLPLIQRVGLPGDLEDSFGLRLDRLLLHPHYLCPCLYIRDGMLARLPRIRPEETSVVYSAKEALPGAPSGVGVPLRILSSSQVNPNKGHAELAHTLAALRKNGLAFHWEVAGTGDALEDLRALCDTLALTPHVTFHGFMRDLSPLLRVCDLFALSSYTEGLPNTLLEAMAHGLVPTARNVGGVAECWPPALAPFLVPHAGGKNSSRTGQGPESLPLYAPLHTLLSAPQEQIRQWKQAAWEHCARHFSLAAQAEKLETFFWQHIDGTKLHT